MAPHSSVLAWRIPGMGEPGGLLSMGSHRVRHDWSDLAAARTEEPSIIQTPRKCTRPSHGPPFFHHFCSSQHRGSCLAALHLPFCPGAALTPRVGWAMAVGIPSPGGCASWKRMEVLTSMEQDGGWRLMAILRCSLYKIFQIVSAGSSSTDHRGGQQVDVSLQELPSFPISLSWSLTLISDVTSKTRLCACKLLSLALLWERGGNSCWFSY